MMAKRIWKCLFSRRAVVHHAAQPMESTTETDIEDIRECMCNLAALTAEPTARRLTARLRAASTAEGLWFLRSELMAALSPVIGEAEAYKRLRAVAKLLDDWLPPTYRSRRSELSAYNSR